MVIAYFTPATGFTGGALIGLSAATLLLLSGDILGASGLVSTTILSPRAAMTDPALAWKMVFLSTFLLLTNVVLGAYFTDDTRLGEDFSIPVVSVYGYLLGGAFVGFGTRLGNGCTTGHGICGMARLSIRSITAVCTFMFTAFCTAALTAPDNKATSKGTSFLRTDEAPEFFNRWLGFGISMIVVLPTLYAVYNLFATSPTSPSSSSNDNKNNVDKETDGGEVGTARGDEESSEISDSARENKTNEGSPSSEEDETNKKQVEGDIEAQQQEPEPTKKASSEQQAPAVITEMDALMINRRKLIPAMLSASIFAVGLAVSGMVLPSKVLGFLNLFLFAEGSYDPTLLTVMVGGCIISFLSYQFVKPFSLFFSGDSPYSRECPLIAPKFSVPTNKVIDMELIGGAMCFGMGWGVAGLCPGPAMFLAATGTIPVICYWWPAFLAGSFVAQFLKR